MDGITDPRVNVRAAKDYGVYLKLYQIQFPPIVETITPLNLIETVMKLIGHIKLEDMTTPNKITQKTPRIRTLLDSMNRYFTGKFRIEYRKIWYYALSLREDWQVGYDWNNTKADYYVSESDNIYYPDMNNRPAQKTVQNIEQNWKAVVLNIAFFIPYTLELQFINEYKQSNIKNVVSGFNVTTQDECIKKPQKERTFADYAAFVKTYMYTTRFE